MIVALSILLVAGVQPPTNNDVVIVRAERISSDQGQAAQVTLEPETLHQNGGQRLDEILTDTPGIGLFRRVPSTVANATIQGLSLRPIAPNGAGRALVSLDGVPQNDPFGSWIFWVRHDPLFLDKVDIRRGAAGAGFGPLALTGTLDLLEARAGPTAWRIGGSDNGGVQLAARSAVETSNSTLTAMAAFERSDGAIPVQASQRGPVDVAANLEAMSATLVSDIAVDNGGWSMRVSGFRERKGAGTVGAYSDAVGGDVSIARKLAADWGQLRVLVYGQTRDFSNTTVSVATDRKSITPALNQYATPSSALGGSVLIAPKFGRLRPQFSVDWRLAEGQTQEQFRVISGAFTRNRLAGGQQLLTGMGLELPKVLQSVDGAAGLDITARVDRWENRNAIRLETDLASSGTTLDEKPRDRDGALMTGKVSVFAFQGQARLSAYRTMRPPSLNELHRPFRIGNDITEANADLRPEVLDGLDADFAFRRPLASGTLQASASIYLNHLTNPVTNLTLGTGPAAFPRVGFVPAGGVLRQRTNVGAIDAAGLELGLAWSNAKGLAARFGASFTDARADGGTALPQLTGKRPAQAPQWAANVGVNWPLTRTLDLDLALRGEGERFEDDLNLRPLKAYGTLDARLNWQIGRGREFYIAAENLADSQVQSAITGTGIVSLAQGRLVRFGVQSAF